MPLRQLLFQCRTQHETENAIACLEDHFPEAFSSISYVRASEDTWEAIAILQEDVAETIPLPDIDALLKDRANHVRVEDVPDQDWIAHTLENLAPVESGRFVVHGSHDRPFCNYGRVGINIDAGLAFGTGHHETTKGCLDLLSGLLKRKYPTNALDLGCGTGVLAIAFVSHSLRTAVASDIDPVAVDVARRNGKHNQVETRIRYAVADGVRHNLIATAAPFDLIFANILATPLKHLAHKISNITAQHGSLILSGLLVEQEASVLSAYRMVDFHLEKRCIIGEWSTLLLTR